MGECSYRRLCATLLSIDTQVETERTPKPLEHWNTPSAHTHLPIHKICTYVSPITSYIHTYINVNLPSLGQLRWERCSNGSEDRTPHPISTSLVLSSESYTIRYIHTYMEESVYLDRSIYKYKASNVRDLTSALLSVATNSNKDQSHSILG